MDKRYHVFVSSTYEDLQEERQEVMQALLELDCMPSGMELFPATNEDQWTLIKKVITECDYYIVILGGRYGSLGSENISFTEMEYRYAESIDKPIIAFLHKDLETISVKKSENDSEKREKLKEFREYAEKKMCRYWLTPVELGSVVSRSMIKLMKSTPAIGWIRADETSDPEMSKENIGLRKRIEELESEISAFETKGPSGIETLAQGNDEHLLHFSLSLYIGDFYYSRDSEKQSITNSTSVTWNKIISLVLPRMFPECSEDDVGDALFQECSGVYENNEIGYDEKLWNIEKHLILRSSVKEVIVQLHALGMISPSIKKRSLNDTSNYWKLTSYGINIMDKSCAIRKK